jgi:hypothetical protein
MSTQSSLGFRKTVSIVSRLKALGVIGFDMAFTRECCSDSEYKKNYKKFFFSQVITPSDIIMVLKNAGRILSAAWPRQFLPLILT